MINRFGYASGEVIEEHNGWGIMQREASRGATMDVGGWLRRLGLEHYEAAFRENEIDDTVLPSLTAVGLKAESDRC